MGGFAPDSFVLEEGGVVKQWLAEDRRVRFRTGVGQGATPWVHQQLPGEVEGIVRRIHFLPTNAAGETIGWLVTQDGYVLKTVDGGAVWLHSGPGGTPMRIPDPASPTGFADLQDIRFIDEQDGWLVGLRRVYWTADAGQTWSPAVVVGAGHYSNVEYYAIDVVVIGGKRYGLLCAEPGIVLRAVGDLAASPTNWLLDVWTVVMSTTELCEVPPGPLSPAGSLECCQTAHCDGVPFEPWDIEIARSGSGFAALCGGLSQQCGLLMTSVDLGATWTIEQHECIADPLSCAQDPQYLCHPNHSVSNPCTPQFGLPPTELRLCRLPTCYGLAILEDDTVVACGYNSFVGVRDPMTGRWHDRSKFISPFLELDWKKGAVYPLFGVSAGSGDGSNGFVLITGQGGHVIESLTGAQTWDMAGSQGTSWRLQDVVFQTSTRGFMVGQHARISYTEDGAESWDHMKPLPGPGLPYLNAIAISANDKGVAVGDIYAPVSGSELPFILRHDDITQVGSDWLSPTTVHLTAPESRQLLDVAWAGGSHFYAAGNAGLVVVSADDGDTWHLIDPPVGGDFRSFDIAGLAFNGPSSGVFLGRNPLGGSGQGPLKGAAWRYKVTGTTADWLDVTPTGAGAPDLERLTAVTVHNGTAWAVGERLHPTTGAREGVVLYSIDSGSGFGPFTALSFAPALCELGGSLDAVPPPPILGAVAVTPQGDVLVGGACGRVWIGTSGGTTWTPVAIPSASHVRSISVVPEGSGNAVFLGCFREGEETQVVLKL